MFCISLFLCQHCTYCFRYESFESAHAYRSYAISKLGGNFKIGGQFRRSFQIAQRNFEIAQIYNSRGTYIPLIRISLAEVMHAYRI